MEKKYFETKKLILVLLKEYFTSMELKKQCPMIHIMDYK